MPSSCGIVQRLLPLKLLSALMPSGREVPVLEPREPQEEEPVSQSCQDRGHAHGKVTAGFFIGVVFDEDLAPWAQRLGQHTQKSLLDGEIIVLQQPQ
jgi:hypothetical protein